VSLPPEQQAGLAAMRLMREMSAELNTRARADAKVLALMATTEAGQKTLADAHALFAAWHPELVATAREMGKALDAVRKLQRGNRWGIRA